MDNATSRSQRWKWIFIAPGFAAIADFFLLLFLRPPYSATGNYAQRFDPAISAAAIAYSGNGSLLPLASIGAPHQATPGDWYAVPVNKMVQR